VVEGKPLSLETPVTATIQTSSQGGSQHADAIFDEQAMLWRLMGDPRLASKILDGFIGNVPSQLNQLRKLIEAADAPGAQSEAHALKGAAASVAGEALAAVARSMEQTCAAGQLDRCGELLPLALQEFERFKSTVERAGLSSK
jgi:HPt (histidine-containing phosphotransfer) domain-containing protein